ncbi:hypothetical protein B296_00038595 [Ensete ventricosum]|uniref:Uncharacterized protein n=1 Tax=Ensete ventricosum TaxID=4639 RepID=A0A426XUE7_ENSVE|nr:hypothetical protein B296_00038595 [Ensete ventricosum]
MVTALPLPGSGRLLAAMSLAVGQATGCRGQLLQAFPLWSEPNCLGLLNKRQYRPSVREGGFPSPNKGRGGGGCGAPQEVS